MSPSLLTQLDSRRFAAIRAPWLIRLYRTIRTGSLMNPFWMVILFSCSWVTLGWSPGLAQEKGNSPNMLDNSPLLKPWTGPYGGVPPWNVVQTDEFVAAFDRAIEWAEAEVNRIAQANEPPTFENTIVALENGGAALDRLNAIFGVYSDNLNLGPVPDIERQVVPKLAAYEDRITQHEQLFKRIEAVHQSALRTTLTATQQRLIDKIYKEFVRKGAKLSAEQKARLSAINQRLATLFTEFSQNVLAEEQGYITWIENPADLAGLPDSFVAAMANAAREKGQPGKWAVTNTRSSIDPFLTYSDQRGLREQVWRRFYARGDNENQHDNKAIITEILRLRAERAKLLGYPTHAHWRLEPSMAKTPEATMDLMMKIWPKAVARVREEVADMQAIADQAQAGIRIEPWDYRYYAEKVRKAKYDLDFNQVKPYLQLDKLVDGMLWASGQLFGLQYRRVDQVPIFHPDVRVWEVLDPTGEHVGLFYLDPYAREGKRSGAWMTAYRVQKRIDNPVSSLVSNNSNFVKAAPDEPVLISWDDATTLFHEFGHALHGLCSKVQYPSQSGTNVPRDYVEFPSQIYEHWLSTPELLKQFAVHAETGESLPVELLEKIERAAKFNQGFATVEYLASALVDMKLHLAGDVTIDPSQFERETLGELGMPREMVMRHRMPHFAHIFSSDGYSAGYYSYLWADTLTADAAEVFKEVGSFYDPATARRLYETVLSAGDTLDPAEGFRRFRGRDVDPSALLRKRGFPVD